MAKKFLLTSIMGLFFAPLYAAAQDSVAGPAKDNPGTLPVRYLSISISRSPAEVYGFVSNPENLPKWAAGLGGSVKKSGGDWIVETPQGPAKIRFAPKNDLGVLDHYVTVAAGVEIYVPLRVIANGSGSEVLLTLFRLPDMTDQQYADDQKAVERDLKTLKEVLER